MRDYKDICIETLAQSEAELLDQIADITIDRDAYQVLAKQLLHGLHHVTVERDRFRRLYHQLLDQLRVDRQQRAA